MLTRILDWFFERFQRLGAKGPMADKVKQKMDSVRPSSKHANPVSRRQEVDTLREEPINRRARRANAARDKAARKRRKG